MYNHQRDIFVYTGEVTYFRRSCNMFRYIKEEIKMDEQNNYQDNTANVPYQAPVGDAGPQKANGLQIASLVVGICAIVLGCCWAYLGLILGIVGIVLAVFGNKQGKNGIGTAGLVCSIVGIVLGLIWIVVAAIFGAAAMQMLQEMGYSI